MNAGCFNTALGPASLPLAWLSLRAVTHPLAVPIVSSDNRNLSRRRAFLLIGRKSLPMTFPLSLLARMEPHAQDLATRQGSKAGVWHFRLLSARKEDGPRSGNCNSADSAGCSVFTPWGLLGLVQKI